MSACSDEASEVKDQVVAKVVATAQERITSEIEAAGGIETIVADSDLKAEVDEIKADLEEVKADLADALAAKAEERAAKIERVIEKLDAIIARVEDAAARAPEGGESQTKLNNLAGRLLTIRTTLDTAL